MKTDRPIPSTHLLFNLISVIPFVRASSTIAIAVSAIAAIYIGPMQLTFPAAASAASQTASTTRQKIFVQVENAKLRAQPQAWAKTVGDVRYGDELNVLENAGESGAAGWIKVQVRSLSGFIHSSAITPRKVVLAGKSGGTRLGADSADIVLAGKGFNREVEGEYARSNPSLNFREVDKMERIAVADAEIINFVQMGKLAR